MAQSLEDKDSILDEVRAERKSLQSELSRYIAMVKQVQKDLELVSPSLLDNNKRKMKNEK